MDPLTISTLVGAGSSLIGGLFGNRSAKKQARQQRRWAIEDQIESLPRLRKSAEKAGYNPLTALMATGGSGFGMTGAVAPLASVSAIQDAVQGIGDVLSGKTAQDAKRQEVQDDLQEIRREQLRAGGTATVFQNTRSRLALPSVVGLPMLGAEQYGQPQGMANVRPKERPGLWSEGATPVIGPDGGNMQIPRKVARRLGLENWDAWIVEDYEATLGDETGQVVALPKIPSAVQQIEGGLFKRRTQDERQELLDNPWSLAPYLGAAPVYERKPKISKPEPGWMTRKFGDFHAQ